MNNKKWLKRVLVGVTILLLMLGGVVFGMNFRTWFPQTESTDDNISADSGGQKLKVDPGAGEYVEPIEQANENQGEGIAIPGWGYITIPAGETDIAVDFPNPEANAEKYYLSFELRLKDSGEVLYASELVPPGQTIQNITLSRALEEGNYQAVIHVQPYKMDENQTPTNNADMETELVVFKN